PWPFWVLPTRLGELLAGAVLAIGGWRLTGRTTRAAVGWCGLVGIVVACFAFDGVPTSWPGLGVLLPVLSTVAVVLAGSGGHRPVGAAVVLGRPLLQWIGRHSYALYLWHWPAYVLAEAQWGPLSIAQRVGVVALSVAVSAASVRFVEDPVRHARRLAAVPARSLALGVALVLVVALVGWNARSSVGRLDGGVEAAAPQLVTTAPTDSP